MPRLVDVKARLRRQSLTQLGIGRLESSAGFADQPGEFAGGKPYCQHVAQERLDGRVGGVRRALEPCHEGRQTCSDQAGRQDLCGQPRAAELAAMRAPVGEGAVLRDDHGPIDQFHLLDHARARCWPLKSRSYSTFRQSFRPLAAGSTWLSALPTDRW